MAINLNMGSRRGATPPKDAMVHDGDLWSPYKTTRVRSHIRHILKTRRARELYGSEADEESEIHEGTNSLHLGGIVLP
jgi:hypothetical protein